MAAVPLAVGVTANAAFCGGAFVLRLSRVRGMSGTTAGLTFVPMAVVVTAVVVTAAGLLSPRSPSGPGDGR